MAVAAEISEVIAFDAVTRIPEVFIRKTAENKIEKRKSEVVTKYLNRNSVNNVKGLKYFIENIFIKLKY